MKPIISVQNLSKQYRLGTIGTGTLREDLQRWWCRVRGKEDPYLKIGETNDRTTKGGSEYVWALRDVNFDVMPGEVLGIIGKNGAGKSTLLKILSKVTGPTTGRIDYNGRIGNLLEVGTGFHPELTGRENIFLNGAILGMSRREIRAKLDEIIDFSGCERYIDTPVKRYSSGMTGRLGFAVAAHLDPEILVIDEVLAVGDAEFQKKAIGKMQDVSRNEGRTVLFVSHNMAAIRNLCSSALVLANGQTVFRGSQLAGIDYYLSLNERRTSTRIVDQIEWLTPDLRIDRIAINGSESSTIQLENDRSDLTIEFSGELLDHRNLSLAICFYDTEDIRIATYDPAFIKGGTPLHRKGPFHLRETIRLPKYINKGTYYLDLFLLHPNIDYSLKAPRSAQLVINGYISANGNVVDSKVGGFLFLEESS